MFPEAHHLSDEPKSDRELVRSIGQCNSLEDTRRCSARLIFPLV